jgi:hypothetical protein
LPHQLLPAAACCYFCVRCHPAACHCYCSCWSPSLSVPGCASSPDTTPALPRPHHNPPRLRMRAPRQRRHEACARSVWSWCTKRARARTLIRFLRPCTRTALCARPPQTPHPPSDHSAARAHSQGYFPLHDSGQADVRASLSKAMPWSVPVDNVQKYFGEQVRVRGPWRDGTVRGGGGRLSGGPLARGVSTVRVCMFLPMQE